MSCLVGHAAEPSVVICTVADMSDESGCIHGTTHNEHTMLRHEANSHDITRLEIAFVHIRDAMPFHVL